MPPQASNLVTFGIATLAAGLAGRPKPLAEFNRTVWLRIAVGKNLNKSLIQQSD